MDIIGPLPESTAGNRYVLVVANYLTRYTETYGIPNQEASTVAHKLVDEFFLRSHQHNSCILIKDVISNRKLSQKCASSLASPYRELHLTIPSPMD